MIAIRPYHDADLDALKVLMSELQAHERQFDPLHVEATPEFAAWYLARLFKHIEQNRGITLVAADGDSICGFGSAYVEEDSERQQEYFYISDLSVSGNYRGKGIDTQLIAALEAIARERGMKRIGIGVMVANEGAYQLYRRLGFADYVISLFKEL
ncbi:MAG: GNAT family N-acetyltransferase [Anaerolineae bacterium]